MSKTFLLLTIPFIVFTSSCSVLKPTKKLPTYTEDEKKVEQMITHQPMTLPGDTTKQIIVYNVVEQDKGKFKISDETIRMFIADLFGTITTIITLHQLEKQP